MTMLNGIRRRLVELAQRHSRVAHEAEDVAHDLVAAALARGLDLEGDLFRRSSASAARRHAAFLARGALRRRERERRSLELASPPIKATAERASAEGEDPDPPLSRSLRTTLLLLYMGLDKAELRAALGLSDAALRQRFRQLRRLAPIPRPRLLVHERSAAQGETRQAQVAHLPMLALSPSGTSRLIGVTDPDGHGIIFGSHVTSGAVAATSSAVSGIRRTPTKGRAC